MLPLALSGEYFETAQTIYVSVCFKLRKLKESQGTFLHQARRAKVQERRQHETLVRQAKLAS